MMLFPKNKRIKGKKHFQLLEVLIAMLLLMTCVAPALHIYMNIYKQEMELAHHFTADHYVRLLHAEITEKMYQNAIPLDSILNGQHFSLDGSEWGKEFEKVGFKGSYQIIKKKQKKSKKNQLISYLIDVNIELTPIQKGSNKFYQYTQFLEAPIPQGEITEDVSECDEEAMSEENADLKQT